MAASAGHLRVADIIVSTTDHAISKGIRAATGAGVSHAMLYIGRREIVEAIGEGVLRRTLSQGLADASLAIALRRPGLSADKGEEVVRHALAFVGRPYDTIGAAGSGTTTRRGQVLAGLGCLISLLGCAGAAGEITRNASPQERDNAFFCSELVARAFELAGMPIIDTEASFTNPRAVRTSRHLQYVTRVI